MSGPTHVEAAPILDLVQEWASSQPGGTTAAFEELGRITETSGEAVRALCRRRPATMSFERADALLVAIGREYEWHDSLASLLPPPAKLSRKVRQPGEQGRLKAHFKSARVTRQQLDAIYVLHTRGMSLRAIARAGWERWGYASPLSCLNSLSTMLRSYGYRNRDRLEATALATTVHGKSRRGQRDPEHRRELRLARGEIRGVQCLAIKTRYGKGRGERCRRPALAGSDYCVSHDPARDEWRRRHLAEARARALA